MKLRHLIITLLLTLTLTLLLTLTASAETYRSVGLGLTNLTFYDYFGDSDENIFVSFTAPEDGTYYFQPISIADTYGVLRDSNGNILSTDDDSAGRSDYRLSRKMSANETVLIETGISFHVRDGDYCGNMPLMIRKEGFTVSNGVLTGYFGFDSAITIPDGVTSINSYALVDCPALTSVTIPNSVTTIGSSAFSYCTALTSITIPGSVTKIDASAFKGCSALVSCSIPESVTDIGTNAFEYCTALASITIPASGRYLRSYAFRGCTSLKSVTICSGFRRIYDNVFNGCTSLTTVTIPDSIEFIRTDSFANCPKLKEIHIDSIDWWLSVDHFSSYLYPHTNDGDLYINGKPVTRVVIPQGKTGVSTSTFRNCTSLASVSIPDSVTSIYDYAFQGCVSLSAANIPAGVTYIGDSAFQGCASLASAIIPANVTTISYNTFKGCTSLTSVTIAGSISTVERDPFEGCANLRIVIFDEGSKKLPNDLFNGCADLTDLYLPESMTTFGATPFTGCNTPNIYCVEYSPADTWASANYPDYVRYIDGIDAAPVDVLIFGKDRIDINTTSVFTAYTFPNGAHPDVVWSSSDPSVLSIDASGLATARARGTVTITAAVGDLTATKTVTAYVPLKSFTIVPAEVWVVAKNTAQLSLSAEPADHSASFTWTSSNTTLASVSDSGLVTTYGVGDITISCTAENGMVQTCVVHATYPVASVSFADQTLDLMIGEQRQLTAAVTDTKGNSYTNRLVTFSSSDESVATVGVDGIVTVVGEGNCVITAASANGKSAECAIATSKCTAHTPTTVPAVPATCTESGLTAGTICSVCRAVIVAQTEIPALGHSYTLYTPDGNGSCTEPGTMTAECDNGCGTTDTVPDTSPVSGHTPAAPVQENPVSATCVTDGGYDTVIYCAACEAELSREHTTVPATGHTPVTDEAAEPGCTATGVTEGTHCSVCGEILTAQRYIPAKGHTAVSDSAEPATCSAVGHTEGKHCSVCGEILAAQSEIPMKGHTVVIDAAVPPSCATAGLTEGSHCSVCGAIVTAQTSVPQSAHTPVTDAAVPATCSATGLTDGSHCSVCNAVIVEQKIIPTTPHILVTDEAVPATCATTGLTEGAHCYVCQQIVVKQESVPPLAHTVVSDPYVAPTRYTFGKTAGSHCSACGAILKTQKTIAKLSNDKLVIIPSLVTALAEETYMNSAVECVIIDAGCKSIGARAFANCAALKVIEIPATLTAIAPDAFSGSPNATIVTTLNSPAMTYAIKNNISFLIIPS